MGCNESRQKEAPPVFTSTTVTTTPLPLYLYEDYVRTTSPGPSPTNSVSSNKSISPKAPSTVPSTPSSTSSLPKSSKAFQDMSTIHLKKLTRIAYYKFKEFHDFSKLVQEQILLHIDKELRSME